MFTAISTNDQVPGPAPVRSLLAQIKLGLEFPRDPLGILARWQAAYGDFYRLQIGEMQQFFIVHPDDIREVLVTQASKFIKDFQYRDPKAGIARYLGNGLLTSDGEFWKRQRRLVAPAFHPKRIDSYAVTMVDYTTRMLAGWRDGARLDIAEEMTRLTLFIVAKALFNADVSGDAPRVAAAMETIQKVMGEAWFLPPWVPDPRQWRANRAKRDLDEIVYRMIGEWRATGEDRGDLLSMLLLAEDEDGRRMTDRQARDELVTLMLAGHETTANTLNWTWMLLAQHPEVEAKLHAELDAVLGGRPPSLEDLPNLAYTEIVVKEAMRLYPAAWAISREAIEDVPLRNGTLPRGSVAGVMIYFTQRDPRWWPDPERFDPERFHAENAAAIPRYAYLPFGGGPRVCIGNGFAMMEARLLLTTIASRYRLELAPGQVVKPAPLITLNPKDGMPMIVRRRSAV